MTKPKPEPEGPWDSQGRLQLEIMPVMPDLYFFYWYCYHAGITKDDQGSYTHTDH